MTGFDTFATGLILSGYYLYGLEYLDEKTTVTTPRVSPDQHFLNALRYTTACFTTQRQSESHGLDLIADCSFEFVELFTHKFYSRISTCYDLKA